MIRPAHTVTSSAATFPGMIGSTGDLAGTSGGTTSPSGGAIVNAAWFVAGGVVLWVGERVYAEWRAKRPR